MQVVGALGWVALVVGVVGLVRGMPWLGPRPRLTAGILVLVGLLGIGIAQGGDDGPTDAAGTAIQADAGTRAIGR